MAPPLDKKPHSYEEMQQTLADLNHDIEIHSQGNCKAFVLLMGVVAYVYCKCCSTYIRLTVYMKNKC